MIAYKLERTLPSGKKVFLCDDNKTFDNEGFTWKKRTSAERVRACFNHKYNLKIIEVEQEDVRAMLTKDDKAMSEALSSARIPADAMKIFHDIMWNMDDLNAYGDKLNEELSFQDKITSDILHYVEMNEIEPSEEHGLLCKLKNARIERRKIKDRLKVLMALRLDIQNGGTENLTKCFAAMNERYYTPKVVTEFGIFS